MARPEDSHILTALTSLLPRRRIRELARQLGVVRRRRKLDLQLRTPTMALLRHHALPAGALTEHSGLLRPLVRSPQLAVLGTVLAIAGVAATSLAQLAMGRSWRIGIRHDEVTMLVTRGPFAWVRNPIYSAMLLAGAGFALLTPAALSLAGFAAMLVALELQVRLVEEPHLRALHGEPVATPAPLRAGSCGRDVGDVLFGLHGREYQLEPA